ncbi:MAG: gliding motility-associated C-terminal domain-containing protein [Cryomorphaceae bacterium]|nr:MAG: gliding motility-associated C-terminal domain-containing protein [Cryomorphaceae bacterium]
MLAAVLTSVWSFAHGPDYFLTPNRGQWHPDVYFRAEIPGGHFFMDRDGFTYALFDAEAMANIHAGQSELGFEDVACHAVKTRFVGAKEAGDFGLSESSPFYFNYYLDSDSSRWATGVRSHEWVKRKSIYDDIDLFVYRKNGVLKYDLQLAAGADPAQVQLAYDGAERLELLDGQLHIVTSVGSYIEQPPFAYQMQGERLIRVACNYRLDGNVLSFEFPDGLDTNYPLVIDPEISFSSFVGSNSSSFGFTATYDDDGNLYAGAIVFGGGYPTSAGAFDAGFNGGTIDAAISKFSADGTALIYSTFLGGAGNECPHSLVVNENNELYVLGSTGSYNFPTTAGSFQPTFGGGTNFNFNVGYGFSHVGGTDIFVCRFNAAGTNLLSSTYVGGSGNDGINLDPFLEYNYGDAFRGEIIVGPNGDVFVASVTNSTDFPTTPGTFQGTYGGGGTDGVVFRMSPNLGNMVWASYIGGQMSDAAFSVQLASNGSVFIAGGTASNNFPALANAYQPAYGGGRDGFVARIAANGQTLTGCTYLGTAFYEEAFFVQLDTDENVWVVGQTEGNYPVSDGVYSNPNSGHFIHKLTPNLTTSLLSTVVGNGNGGPNISLSAFLVSNCDQIYLSGWGGETNVNAGGVVTSTTEGLPITPGAFQTTTNGSDFYLMVLSPDAESLDYATFFGGGVSNEHVDGGTSRFDKRGTVYQAVCAGCGGGSDFPTQPGVWSTTNNANNANGSCNLGVFKFDLATITALISVVGPEEVCAGTTVSFLNNTLIANQFEWDFAGLGSSNATNPSFVFDEPGEYVITMIASDIADCIQPDTAEVIITVVPPPDIELSPGTTICAGDTVQLFVSGGDSYVWFPAAQVSDPTSNSPMVWATENTQFVVTSSTWCGSISDTVSVNIWQEEYGSSDDQTICLGESVQISAFGGVSYSWSPPETLSDPSASNPVATPEEPTTYTVTITSPNGCDYTAQTGIAILPGPPVVETIGTASICDGGVALIWALGGDEYLWDLIPGLNDYNISHPLASPATTTWYYVNVSNQCGTVRDSVLVNVGFVVAEVDQPDTTCPGAPIPLQAYGGVAYSWSPQHSINNPYIANPLASPWTTTTYSVVVTDEFGCTGLASVTVPVHPAPWVFAMADQVVEYYDLLELEAAGNGTLSWFSEDFNLSCSECPSPTIHATETGVVYVSSVDENGCTATDSLLVQVTGALYVPNAFSPNGDGVNDIFKAVGSEIEEFHMRIFNRWGELVFESFDINDGWDGSVNRHYVAPAVFVWEITAREHTGVRFEKRGHVTVVR